MKKSDKFFVIGLISLIASTLILGNLNKILPLIIILLLGFVIIPLSCLSLIFGIINKTNSSKLIKIILIIIISGILYYILYGTIILKSLMGPIID